MSILNRFVENKWGRVLVVILGALLVGLAIYAVADSYGGRGRAQAEADRWRKAFNSQAQAEGAARRLAQDRVEALKLQISTLSGDLQTIVTATRVTPKAQLVQSPQPAQPIPVASGVLHLEPAPSQKFTPPVGPVPSQTTPTQPPVLCGVVDLFRFCEKAN